MRLITNVVSSRWLWVRWSRAPRPKNRDRHTQSSRPGSITFPCSRWMVALPRSKPSQSPQIPLYSFRTEAPCIDASAFAFCFSEFALPSYMHHRRTQLVLRVYSVEVMGNLYFITRVLFLHVPIPVFFCDTMLYRASRMYRTCLRTLICNRIV